MKPPGEEALRSQLIEVRENVCFVDETRVGDLVIKVAHRIEPLGPARTRIVYAVDAQGPQGLRDRSGCRVGLSRCSRQSRQARRNEIGMIAVEQK